MQLNRDQLRQAYRQMKTIREFEERLHLEIQTGEIAGFTHLYSGQEAVAVGICEQLTDDDRIISTHRGHGHCIAKGCDVQGMMAEIYGRATGLCKGKGGSMHIADIERGMLGANGIVGAGAPIAVGGAISAKLQNRGGVSIAFSGDGACNQGTTFEAMNMAVVLKVPAIFVFENNHYSEHTGDSYAVGTANDIAGRAESFGMKAWRGNGCDFFETHGVMAEILAYVRETRLPAAVEFDTERFFGHFEGDAQKYRGPGEIEHIRATRDCLTIFRQRVSEAKLLPGKELDAIDEDVLEQIDAAVAFARSSPPPDPADALADVYINY